MTAQLISSLDELAFSDLSNRERFFGKEQSERIKRNYEIGRELRPIGQPGKSCDVNLFMGFFFDGTRNNYDRSTREKDHTHSNVARLYGAYPGQHVPGVPADPDAQWTTNPDNYQQFFKVYVPGVGTPFTQVDDSGTGKDALLGNATALYGERRILWALAQALNCVYRYLTRSGNGPGLFSTEEVLKFCKAFDLGREELLEAGKGPVDKRQRENKNRRTLEAMLNKLHESVKPHMIDPATGQCSKVDPGRVQRIFVSAFGFSRGAAEARVFVNWFLAMCEIDAQLRGQTGPTLASFPVTFDFLGLFDTVASVGVAASSLFADGHGGWADADTSMRIPADVPCLHIVAAHEFRRSFPSDSVHVGNTLPENSREWVCPGMHSDVGGGYMPKEQGKGIDEAGEDMLSRIPLALMYREARILGVPLKLELARPVIQKQFMVAKDLIRDFNAYLAVCRVKEGVLRDIMAEQRKLFILWRKSWAGRPLEMDFVLRASAPDRADLLSADEQFVKEVKDFEAWLKKKKRISGRNSPDGTPHEIDNVPGIDSERVGEWGRIEPYWNEPVLTSKLFEDRVHDSHAWFKLTGPEAAEFKEQLDKLVARKKRVDEARGQIDPPRGGAPAGLTRRQEQWVNLYLTKGEYAPEFTEGREWYAWGAGYLRYRRVYAGADETRLTQNRRPAERESPELMTA